MANTLSPVQTFVLPEEAIAERLGISRSLIRGARGAENGRWAFGPNRRVLWSENGFAELQAMISAPVREKAPLPEGTEVLVVWNPHVPNRRTLIAFRKGVVPETAAPEERCIVYLGYNGDNRRFLPGMEILARPNRGASWWYEGNPATPENGRRLPRFAGTW